MTRKYELTINGTTLQIHVNSHDYGKIQVAIDDEEFSVQVTNRNQEKGIFFVKIRDKEYKLKVTPLPDTSEYRISVNDLDYNVSLKPMELGPQYFPEVRATPIESTIVERQVIAEQITTSVMEPGTVPAPLPGRIIEVHVKQGETVQQGDVLVVLEAMKMANEIRAPQKGIIEEVQVKSGDTVEKGQPLIKMK